MKLVIIPQHEPRGEGNGWHDCSDDVATIFTVWDEDDEDGHALESFDNRTDAQLWIWEQMK
jgi:hypothetical protein